MAVVRHVLRHPKTGVLLADRAVLFALTPDITVPAEHAQIVGGSYAVTDTNGLLSIDLTPNSQLSPDGTSYVVDLPGLKWLAVVPDTEPPNVDGEVRYWWLDDIRVGSAPDVGPVFHQLPAGGTDGQVLTKASDANFDADWEDSSGGEGGGDVASVFGRTGVVTAHTGDYTPSQVGADAAGTAAGLIATESAARIAADALKADLVAGKVPRNQLPNITSVFTTQVADEAAMLALAQPDPDTSLQVIRTDVPGTAFWLNPGLSPAVLGNWTADPSDPTGAASAAQAAAQAFATAAVADEVTRADGAYDPAGAAAAVGIPGLTAVESVDAWGEPGYVPTAQQDSSGGWLAAKADPGSNTDHAMDLTVGAGSDGTIYTEIYSQQRGNGSADAYVDTFIGSDTGSAEVWSEANLSSGGVGKANVQVRSGAGRSVTDQISLVGSQNVSEGSNITVRALTAQTGPLLVVESPNQSTVYFGIHPDGTLYGTGIDALPSGSGIASVSSPDGSLIVDPTDPANPTIQTAAKILPGTGDEGVQVSGGASTGDYAWAEGEATTASGEASHAEGKNTLASGIAAHAEGQDSIASGDASHAANQGQAHGPWSYAENQGVTTVDAEYSHAEGGGTTSAPTAHAEGNSSFASGAGSHAEGASTASGFVAHAEGQGSTASGDQSHAEGNATTASGTSSHAEGDGTIAARQAETAHSSGGGSQVSRATLYAGAFGNQNPMGMGGVALGYSMPLTDACLSVLTIKGGATSIDGTVSASWSMDMLVDTAGGVARIVGAPAPVSLYADPDAAAWTLTPSVDGGVNLTISLDVDAYPDQVNGSASVEILEMRH